MKNPRAAILMSSFIALSFVAFWCPPGSLADPILPVKVPSYPERSGFVRNPVTWEDLHRIQGPDAEGKGMIIDLHNDALEGAVYTGPYPFEGHKADIDFMGFRGDGRSDRIRAGKGVLPISRFFKSKYDVNQWSDQDQPPVPTHTIGYRLDLTDRRNNRHLGFYDARVSFTRDHEGKLSRALTITEGPFLNTTSDDPSAATISLETDRPSRAFVTVKEQSGKVLGTFIGRDPATRHEISVQGLAPGTGYAYGVRVEDGEGQAAVTREYAFTSAPEKGRGPVTFAFASDSREGSGGGERASMGVNQLVLGRCAQDAFRRGAEFFVFGGDLVNGYTSEKEDFRLQLKAWKQTMEGFWRTRSVFTTMGNHEVLGRVYDDGSRYGLYLDRWPYDRDSAEAVFAAEFVNPVNGPAPEDSRRPPYAENVFHFQYGPVLFIAFNNNYWWTSCIPGAPDKCQCEKYGGSPEGYIMEDQLQWIERALARAEKDPSIRQVFLFTQEPVFPCGGHVTDAMWWEGNNRIRAYVKDRASGRVRPEPLGIIQVRNRLWEAVSGSSKVAAVLTGDEHAYFRTLIDKTTPVGMFPRDDTDGDQILDRYSANPAFKRPVWQLTVGTAGAPFYSREKTPWKPVTYSSQSGYTLFTVKEDRVSMQFITVTGQILDAVEDLMAVKGSP